MGTRPRVRGLMSGPDSIFILGKACGGWAWNRWLLRLPLCLQNIDIHAAAPKCEPLIEALFCLGNIKDNASCAILWAQPPTDAQCHLQIKIFIFWGLFLVDFPGLRLPGPLLSSHPHTNFPLGGLDKLTHSKEQITDKKTNKTFHGSLRFC